MPYLVPSPTSLNAKDVLAFRTSKPQQFLNLMPAILTFVGTRRPVSGPSSSTFSETVRYRVSHIRDGEWTKIFTRTGHNRMTNFEPINNP